VGQEARGDTCIGSRGADGTCSETSEE
jgi:hypothetical protein